MAALCFLTSSVAPLFSAIASETIQYHYDERGRLTQVSRSGTINDGIQATYNYDRADNRVNVAVTATITLLLGQSIWSADGRFQLIMQTDGNLVLYGPDGYMWQSATQGGPDRRMVMQGDGNLVVYNGANQALWHTNTDGNPGAYLSLQNDGNLVIYSSSNQFLWHTNTPYAAPSFSIGDASTTEGGSLTFTVTRSKATTATHSVNFSTANGTATAGSDYNAGTGSVSFAPSEMTKPITVGTIDDAAGEGAETVLVNLTGVSAGAALGDSQGIGTINDNDAPPACAGVNFTVASNAAVTEGANSVFTVTKTGAATGNCDVSYGTVNGTAAAGSDYTAASGTLTFTSGQQSLPVSVATADDTGVESAETFSLTLSSPTDGAALGAPSSATATINDNDGITCSGVSFAINDRVGDEGATFVFTVTKSGTATGSCSVSYATSTGSAGTGDFTSTSGTLTFASGETSKTISVASKEDVKVESDETFFVNLSGATGGASISDAQGKGTIADNDCGTCLMAPPPQEEE